MDGTSGPGLYSCLGLGFLDYAGCINLSCVSVRARPDYLEGYHTFGFLRIQAVTCPFSITLKVTHYQKLQPYETPDFRGGLSSSTSDRKSSNLIFYLE